jgi:hypothetical protein
MMQAVEFEADVKGKTIREQAIAFGKEHRTFPLNWNRSKISREKMNER